MSFYIEHMMTEGSRFGSRSTNTFHLDDPSRCHRLPSKTRLQRRY